MSFGEAQRILLLSSEKPSRTLNILNRLKGGIYKWGLGRN